MNQDESKTWNPPGGSKAWTIWALASLFYLYEFAVRVAPSVMVDELQIAFSINATQLAGTLAIYYYIYSPMQFVVGILFDRFGGKRLLVPATLILAGGCFLASTSEGSLFTLGSSRFLMGLGSAFGFVGVMYLASVWFPHNRLALISGLTTSLGMVGGMLGEHPLSLYVDQFGWDMSWIWFSVGGVFIALMMVLIIPAAPKWEVKRRQKHFSKDNRTTFLDSLWAVVKNPQTWLIGFIGASLYMSLSVFADQWGIQYLMNTYTLEKSVAAKLVAMVYIGWLVGGPIAGFLSDKLKHRKLPLLIGCLGSVMCFIILVLPISLPSYGLHTLLFIMGLVCSTQVITFVANMEITANFARGTAVAFTNMVVMLLGGLFQHFFGYILDFVQGSETIQISEYSSTSFRIALTLIPCMLFLSLIASFFIKETFFADEEETRELL